MHGVPASGRQTGCAPHPLTDGQEPIAWTAQCIVGLGPLNGPVLGRGAAIASVGVSNIFLQL